MHFDFFDVFVKALARSAYSPIDPEYIEDACGVAPPHPQSTPKQSAGIVWASSPSQGSAGRVQDEVHEKITQKRSFPFVVFSFFGSDLWGPGASQRQLPRWCQTRRQNMSDLTLF